MDAHARNRATSYGLTLVAGLPLPAALTAGILRFQQRVEQAAPGCFQWYAAEHLHVTLAAPIRGRYRDAPALRRSELPADLSAFFADLVTTCRALPPLALTLGPVKMDARTLLVDVYSGGEHAPALRELLARHGGWDRPKLQATHLHLSTGYLVPGADEQFAIKAISAAGWASDPRAAVIDEIALVHYANRTLSAVLGEVRLHLGAADASDEAAFLSGLGILG